VDVGMRELERHAALPAAAAWTLSLERIADEALRQPERKALLADSLRPVEKQALRKYTTAETA
jgi:hypothetical protein